MSWYTDAEEKLSEGIKSFSGSNKGSAVKMVVYDALLDFCRQDDEFAQAVVQGGSFKDCVEYTVKSCGSAISDLALYQRAVSFYFNGAKVAMTLQIILEPAESDATHGIVLKLSDFV